MPYLRAVTPDEHKSKRQSYGKAKANEVAQTSGCRQVRSKASFQCAANEAGTKNQNSKNADQKETLNGEHITAET